MKNRNGFTIVELLIVVVIIGILSAIVITTYTGIQARGRNAERQTDIQSLQTQIEAYFQTNGNYPSLTDMNNSSWVSSHLPHLDTNALQDPSNSTMTLSSTPTAKQYAYQPLNDSGTSCENDDTTCSQYTLTATLENNAGTYVKKSLN